MAKTTFRNLDDEARALHDSWDHIARLFLVVTLVAGAVWAACTALRWAVHEAAHAALHGLDHGAIGWLGLAAALAAAGGARAWLLRHDGWADAAGDGMDVALRNYHVTYQHSGDDPQPRYDLPAFGLAARKALMTLLTLGPGGSGGLEAPTVLIGEATAAGVSRVMRAQSEYELRTYQLAGIAAAVGTLLGAPFTAALFATEVAYGDRIIYRKAAYAMWASVVCYTLNNRLQGYKPLFDAPPHAETYALGEYAATVLVAVAVSAPAAVGFAWTLKAVAAAVERVAAPLRGAVTGVATAAVAAALWYGLRIGPEHVLGMGEATVQGLLTGDPALSTWWVLLLIVAARAVTTALTVAGGGSAGMLVPSMVIGGTSGALVAHLLALVGLMPGLDPRLFTVVGVASALVAVVGVPLAAIALVLEVFGRAFGPPAILACGVTYLLTLRFTLYEAQRSSPDPEGDETGAGG